MRWALGEHHALLMANCLAQSQALMKGRTLKEAEAQLLAMGKSKAEAKSALAPHRVFTGNRPSITIAYRSLIRSRSAASSRFMSTASSSKLPSGASTPSISGAWSLARNWRRDCSRWWRQIAARTGLMPQRRDWWAICAVCAEAQHSTTLTARPPVEVSL
jgi:hypothetical protein